MIVTSLHYYSTFLNRIRFIDKASENYPGKKRSSGFYGMNASSGFFFNLFKVRFNRIQSPAFN